MLSNKRFSQLPIPRKLVIMMMISSLLVLVLGTSTILCLEIYRMRNSILSNVVILADITGNNCAAAILFNDDKSALETLETLRFHPRILHAVIRNTAGVELASYVSAGHSDATPTPKHHQTGHSFTLKELHLTREIVVDGGLVGSVSLGYDLGEIYQRILEYCSLMLILFAGLATLSKVLADRLQKFISLPIQRLGEMAHRISVSKNYSLRASKESDDETGDLVDRFNEMLALVEERDQALEARKYDLEEEVRLRTDDLIKEKNKAEQASLSKSRFLANMSHEIRTPMIGVIGMSELLREQDLTPDNMQLVETIYNSGTALLTILNDVLDFSKIEAERLDLHLAPTDLLPLLQEVVDLMTVNAVKKGISLHLETPTEVPLLLGDKVRIRQILLNLIGNAVKFTDKGEIAVKLSVTHKDSGGIYDCQIQIADSGIGIPQEMHERIFDSFDQGETPLAKSASGTGLGLSIVKELVALMNGSVTVSSFPGEGTTFTVLLPLVQFDLASDPLPQELCQSEEAIDTPFLTSAGGRNWRVLLAEDNPTTQGLLKILLQRMPIDLLIVDNGLEAVESLTNAPFDLVLMDCQMPKLDGLATTVKLRAMGVTIPIIALTAYARSEDEQECLAAGMNGYLRKPFRQAELRQVLARWLVPASHHR